MSTKTAVNGLRKSAPPAITLTLDMDTPPAPAKPVRRASVPRAIVVKAAPAPEARVIEPAPVAKKRPPRPNSGEPEGEILSSGANAQARNRRSVSSHAPQNWGGGASSAAAGKLLKQAAPAPIVAAVKPAPVAKAVAVKAASVAKASAKQAAPVAKAVAKAVAAKAKQAAKPPITKSDVVRLEAALALQGGRLWRMSGRHAVAYVGRAELACALLAVDTRHLAGAAMAVYYDKKGRATGWQVRFDAGRWEEIARLLG